MLKQHEIFQAQFYGPAMGMQVDLEKLKKMPHYELTQRFCERYDQTAFDPKFVSKDIAFFTPFCERVFSREPFWHTPGTYLYYLFLFYLLTFC